MNVIKVILGGVVAVLSALGLMVTLLLCWWFVTYNFIHPRATGVGAVAGGFSMLLHSAWFWFGLFVALAIGLFLSYRKLYF